jgi:hypothetical protein
VKFRVLIIGAGRVCKGLALALGLKPQASEKTLPLRGRYAEKCPVFNKKT